MQGNHGDTDLQICSALLMAHLHHAESGKGNLVGKSFRCTGGGQGEGYRS